MRNPTSAVASERRGEPRRLRGLCEREEARELREGVGGLAAPTRSRYLFCAFSSQPYPFVAVIVIASARRS